MNVIFYLDDRADDEHRRLHAQAEQAARTAMPHAMVYTIYHTGPEVFALRRARAQADTLDDALFIDVDCQIRADVSDVFNRLAPGELALPLIDDPAVRYSGGVVFSRSPQFWHGWVKCLEAKQLTEEPDSRELLDWFQSYVDRYAGRVVPLNWRQYEAVPLNAQDPCPGAKIVHYRGPRKGWWL